MTNEGIINKLSRYFDFLAHWAVVAVMAVTVANVVLRLIGYPLRGTVEYVQIFTALAIGLSLAHCSVKGGHVAVTFLVDKFPLKVQVVVDFLMDLISFTFLLLGAWQLYLYAAGMKQTGEIGMTTGIPFYPFVYIVAVGFLLYSLVVLRKILAVFSKTAWE